MHAVEGHVAHGSYVRLPVLSAPGAYKTVFADGSYSDWMPKHPATLDELAELELEPLDDAGPCAVVTLVTTAALLLFGCLAHLVGATG